MAAVCAAGGANAQELKLSRDIKLNVRKGPGTQYAVTGSIASEDGDLFQVRKKGDWVFLYSKGWVNAAFVERRYPLMHKPAPTVAVVPPRSRSADISVVAVSPSDDLLLVRNAEGRHYLYDVSSQRRLTEISALKDAGAVQFLDESTLVAGIAPDWSDRAEQQRLIDIASDTVIYEGSRFVYPIITRPGQQGQDNIVMDTGPALLSLDPDRLETVEPVVSYGSATGLTFNDYESYVRAAGRTPDGTARYMFQGQAENGRIAVRAFDLRGRAHGPAIELDPGECLFDVYPKAEAFVTVAPWGNKADAALPCWDTDLRQPFHVPEAEVRARGFHNVRIRRLSDGSILKHWGQDEKIEKVRGDRNGELLHLERDKGLGNTDTETLNVATMQSETSEEFTTREERLGIETADPMTDLAAMMGVTPLYNTGRFGIAPTGALSIPRSTVKEGRPGGWMDFQFDFEQLRATTKLGGDPYTALDDINSYLQMGGFHWPQLEEIKASRLDLALLGLPNTRYGNEGVASPRGAVVVTDESGDADRAVGIFHPGEGARFVPLEGVVEVSSPAVRERDSRNTGGNRIDLGDYPLGMDNYDFVLGGLDRARKRAKHLYDSDSFTFSRDGESVFAQRYAPCDSPACDGLASWAHGTAEQWQRLWRELVIFDTETGRIRGVHRLPFAPSCNRHDSRLRWGDDRQSLLFRFCRNKDDGRLRRLDLQSGEIIRIGAKGLMQKLERRHGGIPTLNYALLSGGRILAAAGTRGPSVGLYDLESGDRLADLYLYLDGGWVLMTPDGFYTAGKGGDAQMNVRQGVRLFQIERFRTALFRPDLVYEALQGDPEGLVRKARRTTSLEKVLQSGEAPGIELTADQARGRASVTIALADEGGGIGQFALRVNGVVRHRAQGRDRQVVAVDLAEGRNVVQAVARNAADTIENRSETVELEVAPEDAAPPRLFVVTVGADDYALDALKLKYASSDARRVREAFEAAGRGLYDEIFTYDLLDEEASHSELEATFEELARIVRPNDVFVFFMAGHGKTVDGRYYFVPPAFNGRSLNDLKQQAIGQSQLADWFSKVPAQKSALLFDTCDSGSMVETTVGRELRNSIANEMLGNSIGRAVISASSSVGVALEGYKGSGLFTHVLIEALATADEDRNGTIDIDELADEIAQELPELADEQFSEHQQSRYQSPAFTFEVVKSQAAAGP